MAHQCGTKGPAITKPATSPVQSMSTALPEAKSSAWLTSHSSLHLFVSVPVFDVTWWCVVFLHGVDSAFLVATTRLYYWLLHDRVATLYLLDNLSFSVSYHELRVMTWGFAVLASAHAAVLARAVFRSVSARHLTFAQRQLSSNSIQERPSAAHSSLWNSSKRQWGRPWWRAMQTGVEHFKCKWIQPVFNIDGEFFDHYFLLEECLEVAFQVYQANRMSVFIATRWINNLVVMMIFVNCISTPLLYVVIPASNPAPRRIASVALSAFLNFINSVTIPLVIFHKYLRDYDPAISYFPNNLLFDDVWYVKAMYENEQLLVTPRLDFISTIWPHYDLLHCLLVCQSLLRRHNPSVPKPWMVAPMAPVPVPAPASSHASPCLESVMHLDSAAKPKSKSRVESILSLLLSLAGVVVLVLHIGAQSVPELNGCRLHGTPWVNQNSSCAVMNVNCYRRQIQGNSTEINAILSQLNTKALFTVIFSHCERLEIPPAVRDFTTVNGIEIYNSTLVRWPQESSIVERISPQVAYVIFAKTNLTSGVPEGLLEDHLPFKLHEIDFIQTNLSSLPTELPVKWKDVQTIIIESGQLAAVPSYLAQMELGILSLTGNPITEIDFDLFAAVDMYTLRLSATPLAHLPNTTSGDLAEAFRIELEYTQLQAVPTFLQDWYLLCVEQDISVRHSLFGSPFCSKSLQDDDQATSRERDYHAMVCARDHNSRVGSYPMALVAAQRPP